MMGLFAELNHAWIAIDNALYLWDYTNPNHELLGFEEQPHSITAVKLVVPRPGVFVPQITRLLVVATTSDIHLIGVASQSTPGGVQSVSLYKTGMHVSIKGVGVQCIAGSAKTGRIFFGGRGDQDVYELTYQQEEKWFQNRCGKINQTGGGMASVMPSFLTGNANTEHITQIVIDDSRDVCWVLSSKSAIRGFQIRSPNVFAPYVDPKTHAAILSDVSHRFGPSPLIGPSTSITSISPISAKEASRLTLVATTSTGCRIFFSSVPTNFYNPASSSMSMQVHHVRFPPKDTSATPPQPIQQQQPTSTALTQVGGMPSADSMKTLTPTRFAARFAPGYFFCFVQKGGQDLNDTLFVAAPDSGMIAKPQDSSLTGKLHEFGLWLELDSRAEDVGEVTKPFSAAAQPTGFGNELAVQIDQSVTEIAVMTNAGIHTFRRRRMVDIFAATVRYGGGDEGLEGEIRNFVRRYGRGETIATALAVACGQASDVTVDSRVAKVTDPQTLEYARKAFIDYGGKAILNENSMVDQGAPAIDNVRPSPRHEGLALYITRLLRSVWKAQIVLESRNPTGGLQYLPALALSKLHEIQRDLTRLQEFLNTNATFIEGLAGPEALGRVSTKQDEVALQGEHRALKSLQALISDVIEGIAFVLVLFDERVDEIVVSIPENSRSQVKQITYERLFCTQEGKDLAKELVKAIVERNIRAGSNVDTVTDALRRRCGSFCSADDCVIFKAQEQLKRASDTNSSTEQSRNLLNESLRLLQTVAASLTMEQLRTVVDHYISMEFFAGAIQLALTVAQESDRGNRAIAWIIEGKPAADPRAEAFESRVRCYDLIHSVISALDRIAEQGPEIVDGQYTTTTKRKHEAYDVVNASTDEVFQTNLYDWYLSQGWSERLLEVQSPFVVSYLERKSQEDVSKADLLWRYHAQYNNFMEAAVVQLELAKSAFDLGLEDRIQYLSRAHTNAQTRGNGLTEFGRSRQSKQELLREISDLLDVANIQADVLQRMRSDERLGPERRPQVLKQLNGQILPVDELYNGYTDQAGYFDLCLLIYQVADYRSPADIQATWQNLIEQIHTTTTIAGSPLPFEKMADEFRMLGRRLNLSESTFPVRKSAPSPLYRTKSSNFAQPISSPCLRNTHLSGNGMSALQPGSLTSSSTSEYLMMPSSPLSKTCSTTMRFPSRVVTVATSLSTYSRPFGSGRQRRYKAAGGSWGVRMRLSA